MEENKPSLVKTFTNLRDGVKKLEVMEYSIKNGYVRNICPVPKSDSLLSGKLSLASPTIPNIFSSKFFPEIKRLPVLYGITNPPISLSTFYTFGKPDKSGQSTQSNGPTLGDSKTNEEDQKGKKSSSDEEKGFPGLTSAFDLPNLLDMSNVNLTTPLAAQKSSDSNDSDYNSDSEGSKSCYERENSCNDSLTSPEEGTSSPLTDEPNSEDTTDVIPVSIYVNSKKSCEDQQINLEDKTLQSYVITDYKIQTDKDFSRTLKDLITAAQTHLRNKNVVNFSKKNSPDKRSERSSSDYEQCTLSSSRSICSSDAEDFPSKPAYVPPHESEQQEAEGEESSKPRKLCLYCSCRRLNASHALKNKEGETICPVLSKYICSICGATGRRAHTEKYCEQNPVTKAIVSELSSVKAPAHLRKELKRIYQVMSAKCEYCKQANRPYNHFLTDPQGNVECPVLFSSVCQLCGATGKKAHSIKFCDRRWGA